MWKWCRKLKYYKQKCFIVRRWDPIEDVIVDEEIWAHYISVDTKGNLLFYNKIDKDSTETIHGIVFDVWYEFWEKEENK